MVLSAVAKNSNNINRTLDLIFNAVQKRGKRAYLVGGPVRDFLLRKRKVKFTKQDLDVAVTDFYEEIGKELAQKLNAKITHYPQFMTMTLVLPDKTHIDIAQTRKEIYPEPGALPVVRPAPIEADLRRRDFTINAMAIEITKPYLYRVIELFDCQSDLKQGLIRILHPRSFYDDPTRIFRAVRFAIRFGFTIESETKRLMQEAIKDNYLQLLSGERILYELKMIFREKKDNEILKSLQKYGVFERLYDVKMPFEFFETNTKITMFAENDYQEQLKLINFFYYIPVSKWEKYPLEKEITNSVKALQNFSTKREKLASARKPSQIYEILKPIPDLSLELLSLSEPAAIPRKIKQYINNYSKVKIFTNGETLKKLKIPPGPSYTEIMNELLKLKLDGKIKTKKDEINHIKEILSK